MCPTVQGCIFVPKYWKIKYLIYVYISIFLRIKGQTKWLTDKATTNNFFLNIDNALYIFLTREDWQLVMLVYFCITLGL